MSESPIKKIRREAGLSIHAFANLLKVSVPVIQQAENGACQHPKALFQSLFSLGYDSVKLEKEYETFKEARAQEARKKLSASNGR